jgi:ubiquinone/menaquinone biosynthesis C-methylase UbiE
VSEDRRLEDVYRGYEGDAATQRRWDTANPGNAAILDERDAALRRTLAEAGVDLGDAVVVDVGAGAGDLVRTMTTAGASVDRIVALDLRRTAFDRARAEGGTWSMVQADGAGLPLRGRSADVVLLFTVLSSVPEDAVRRRICAEAARVTRAGGVVVLYDMVRPNPRNPNVRRTSIAFVRGCFAGCEVSATRLTLLPPLARRLPGRWYRALARLPWLTTHVMVTVRAGAARSGGSLR